MTHQLDLDIHGTTVRVLSQHASLDVLTLEFQYFIRPVDRLDFTIVLHLTSPPWELLPSVAAARVSANSLEYNDGPRRWHDFHGQALSSHDPERRQGVIWSADPDRLHELAYLMILSFSGKALDQRGLHKVHACGFRYKNRDVLVMLPSHGGKTTLLIELARIPGVALLSDDTPLVDSQGRLHPFPLRLGVIESPLHLKGEFPIFKRNGHVDKYLIPLGQLGAPLAHGPGGPVTLLFAQRWRKPETNIQRLSPLESLRGLMTHMVIGVGLPMVMEWFVMHTWRDWLRLVGIAAKRSRAALRLWQHGDSYSFTMGTDPTHNARALVRFLDQK